MGSHTSTNAGKTSTSYEHSTTDQSTTYNNQWGENNVRGGNVGAGAVIGLQNLPLASIPSYASLHAAPKAPTYHPSNISGLDLAGYHPSTHAPATHAPVTHAPATHTPTTYAPSSSAHHAQTMIAGINALAGAGQVASGLWGNYNTMKTNDLLAQQMAQMQQMQAQMQAMKAKGYQVPNAIVMLI